MNIFLYEFLTGGGFYSIGESPQASPSLLQEGAAMVQALAEDLLATGDIQLHLFRDTRVSSLPLLTGDTNEVAHGLTIHDIDGEAAEQAKFAQIAAAADWTIVIAPEFDGLLAERCNWVHEAGGRLLGPSLATIVLTSDKQRTVEHLAAHAVPTPNGVFVPKGERMPANFPCPAVLKMRDGAGSTNSSLLSDEEALTAHGPAAFDTRLERYQPGTPVSVAVLCGPGQPLPLTPCQQRIADDGQFSYLGGSLPLPTNLSKRATSLAREAIATLPDPLGYIGVDLVLGSNASDDVVLEINPRLTTSYVGLRAATNDNLARVMLDIATGQAHNPTFDDRELEFNANGTVRITTDTPS